MFVLQLINGDIKSNSFTKSKLITRSNKIKMKNLGYLNLHVDELRKKLYVLRIISYMT